MLKRKAQPDNLHEFCSNLPAGCKTKFNVDKHVLDIHKSEYGDNVLNIESIYFILSVDLDSKTSILHKFFKPLESVRVSDEALGLVDFVNKELKIRSCTL
jgi:hypothetical protein